MGGNVKDSGENKKENISLKDILIFHLTSLRGRRYSGFRGNQEQAEERKGDLHKQGPEGTLVPVTRHGTRGP